MGLFSGKKKVLVSSVAYNLAGGEDDRADFLKTATISAVLGNKPSIPDAVTNAYRSGPGSRLKNFARWARSSGYSDDIGLATGSIISGDSIDTTVLAGELPHTVGTTVVIQTAVIDRGDYSYWVEQHILNTVPDQINTGYLADFNEATSTITITYEDTSTEDIVPTGFDPLASYLFASYSEATTEVDEPVVTGSTTTLGMGDPWPSTAGWTYDTAASTPDHDVYTKVEMISGTGDGIFIRTSTMYFDTVLTVRSWRIDTQDTSVRTFSDPMIFIYQQNTGNAVLDAMWAVPDSGGDFLPVIPIRLNNQFVSDLYPTTIYPQSKRAVRRALGSLRYDTLEEKVADNPSLADIDYAYAVFGVSLNVKENASRKYIYKFFEMILEDPTRGGLAVYEDWKDQFELAKASWEDWSTWRQNVDTSGLWSVGPEPMTLPYPPMPFGSIEVTTDHNLVINYNIRVSWNTLVEETGSGILDGAYGAGDLWFTQGTTEEFEPVYWVLDPSTGLYAQQVTDTLTSESVTLNWQVSATSWKRLVIGGLKHRNLIYGGKSVDTLAVEALDDTDESGFIIPLHEDVYKALPIKDQTQMATACCFLVFNCYQVVKTRWYQTGFFKLLLVIAVIAITYFTGGFGASSVGLLGANAAVGAMLGVAAGTVAATVVGAIANAVAAMVLTAILQKGATALFGDKLGAIIGTIASIVALQVGTGLMNGTSFSSSFGSLMRVDNILKLTLAAGDGIAGYLQGQAAETMAKTAEVNQDYATRAKEIEQAFSELTGGVNLFNPLQLVDAPSRPNGSLGEPLDTFLQRTLMVGSDVADMTFSMLSNFTDITLSTDLPITG
jgi:hypothetical protein